MTAFIQISINLSPSYSLRNHSNDSNKKHGTYIIKSRKPINCYCCHSRTKVGSFRVYRFRPEALRDKLSFPAVGRGKIGILVGRGRRVTVVKSNNGFNWFGSGGEEVNSEIERVLGNLALAILLTYLSTSGQLGWLLDAIASIWLPAVLVPIVGIGAFLLWARWDIVESSCPNCESEFQVFESTLKDEVQLCPFCSQPFSVEFSDQSTVFDQLSGEFSRTKKGKSPSFSIVDVEAEIRDTD